MFKSRSHYWINQTNTPSQNGALVIAKLVEEKSFNKNVFAYFLSFVLIFMIVLQVNFVYASEEEQNPITSPITSEETPSPEPSETPAPTNAPSGGTSSNGGNAYPFHCPNQAPQSAPLIVHADYLGNGKVNLAWIKALDPVDHYALEFGLEPGKMLYGNDNIQGGNTVSYTVTHLAKNKTYYFRIRAGHACMPGEFSKEVAVKTTENALYFKPQEIQTKGGLINEYINISSNSGTISATTTNSNDTDPSSPLASLWAQFLAFFN